MQRESLETHSLFYTVSCFILQPPVGVVEPRTILSSLDNALDIAEMHKGQGAILKKVSVVTKPKGKLGKIQKYALLVNIGRLKLQDCHLNITGPFLYSFRSYKQWLFWQA